ncbi:MAG TPA: GAF domain-containing protein, partial [Anaerolineae bacterium]|nr:GAF domain-containing protein [Anaerolineae bacterium]
MANKTITQLQTKLNKLALKQPQLQENKQWTEVLRDLEGLSHNTSRQELLLETIAALSDAASSIPEVDDLLRVSINLIRDYFDFYHVAIFLTDESNEWAVLRAGTGELGQNLLEKQRRLKIGSNSLIGQCIFKRQPYIALDDVGKERSAYSSALLPETRSEIGLPLINRGQVIGALDLQSSEPAAFSQDDTTLFQTLADQLANTIQNAQLFTENTRLLEQAENNRRFLKTVIEHIPDPIFIKDKNHTLLEMNQANAQVIGRSERELLGRTDRDFLPAELAEEFYQRDNEVFTSNQIFVAEDKTIWGDGQEHTAHTRLIPIPNSAGQPEYLLGITQDVTEVRAREAERERLLAETAALYKGSQTIASALSERQIFEALFDQIRLFDPCEISAFRFNLVDNEPTWAELRVNWQKLNNP